MTRLAVDWTACDGRGLCAELLPERITRDEWGYPVFGDEPLQPGLIAHARRAVAACPKLALRLEEEGYGPILREAGLETDTPDEALLVPQGPELEPAEVGG